jgi:epsilon-lactone hydrolase
MPSEQFDQVVAMIRAAPSNDDVPLVERRAAMEAGAAVFPVPTDVEIEPTDAGGVPAEWLRAPESSDATLVYLHGGAYVGCSPRTHRNVTARLAKLAHVRVLSVEYRLAPEHPHPAAVEDAVAAYRSVLDAGTPAKRVAIAGDSAGGGLTVATLVAARDAGLPMPACAVTISPWVDMEGVGESWTTKAEVDPMIDPDRLRNQAGDYLGGQDPRTPLAAPMYADLSGLPPLLIHVGDAEVLLDDSTVLAQRAQDAGVPVTLEVWPDMIHVWHIFAGITPEGDQGLERAADFLREHLRA